MSSVSIYQPLTSSAVEYDGKQAGLASSALTANPNRILATDGTGVITSPATCEAYLPPSIELTGGLTASTVSAQSATIQNGVTAATYNGVAMPSTGPSSGACWMRQTTQTFNSLGSTGKVELAWPGEGNFAGVVAQIYHASTGTFYATQKASDDANYDNKWAYGASSKVVVAYNLPAGTGGQVTIWRYEAMA